MSAGRKAMTITSQISTAAQQTPAEPVKRSQQESEDRGESPESGDLRLRPVSCASRLRRCVLRLSLMGWLRALALNAVGGITYHTLLWAGGRARPGWEEPGSVGGSQGGECRDRYGWAGGEPSSRPSPKGEGEHIGLGLIQCRAAGSPLLRCRLRPADRPRAQIGIDMEADPVIQ
jgi:hypothetical protein